MKQLDFKIADFTIRILFKKNSNTYHETFIYNEIYKNYKYFINTNTSLKIDFTIEFIERKIFTYDFIPHGNKIKLRTLINYYEKINSKKIRTYFYISIIQFHRLLMKIIENLLFTHHGLTFYGIGCHYKNGIALFTNKSNIERDYCISLLKKNYSLLPYDYLIIRKVDKSFKVFATPMLKNEDNFIFDAKMNLEVRNVYIPKMTSLCKMIEAKNKETLLAILLKRSPLAKLMQQIEYNSYAHKYMQSLIEFINTHTFYHLCYQSIINKSAKIDKLLSKYLK